MKVRFYLFGLCGASEKHVAEYLERVMDCEWYVLWTVANPSIDFLRNTSSISARYVIQKHINGFMV